MDKHFKSVLAMSIAFVLGCGFNSMAISNSLGRVAVVDVPKVVAQSTQVKNLRTEQEKKKAEFVQFMNKAKSEIDAQSDINKKKSLAQKYEKELAAKREAAAKDYAKKLQAIDANITSVIVKEAQSMGYEVVLAKNSVLYGGDNITDTIVKNVK